MLFRESDGSIPTIKWLDTLPRKARDKCVAKLRRLRELGFELRRPEADLLREGIYELRVGFQGVNYRLLYFFDGNIAAVVSHGLIKERVDPPIEIDRAIRRKYAFLGNRPLHSAEVSDV